MSFAEQNASEAYKEAIKGAIGSADGAAEKVITAIFSVATAYGALIALVKPKDDPGPIALALPFVLFAIALVLALYARGRGITSDKIRTVDELHSELANVIGAKRRWFGWTVAALAASFVVAGFVVANAYGAQTDPASGEPTLVNLNREGLIRLEGICEQEFTNPIEATSASLDGGLAQLQLGDTCDGQKVSVPVDLVESIVEPG